MLPKFIHIFSRQLNSHEKELIMGFFQMTILTDTKALFVRNLNTIECKIPFFVSRWNPYGIFDTIQCTFEDTEFGNTKIYLQSFHVRSVIAKIGVGLCFGIVLFYVVSREDVFWKISLYTLMIIVYILGLLWAAHIRNRRLFQKIIDYSESL